MVHTLQLLVSNKPSFDLINLYRKHKENCVFQIYTEFAFVIYDESDKSFFAARDPVGLKALYYVCLDGKYHFSSDIEELLSLAGLQKKANIAAMAGIVQHSSIAYTDTMYVGIKRLPPGHYMTISDAGECKIVRYWKPEKIQIDRHISRESAARKFKQLFDQAISDRIDDPASTACELSGGLDSSSIVSWIKHKQPELKLRCFAMTFDSLEECNETKYINEIDETLDIKLIKLQTDTLDYQHRFSLEANYEINPHWPIFITYTMGFPLVEKARQLGVKTILTGQGGDHVMAGNLYCFHDYLRQLRWKMLLQEFNALGRPAWLLKRFMLFPCFGKRGLKILRKIRHPFRSTRSLTKSGAGTAFEEFSELYTGKSQSFKYDLANVVDSMHSALYENSYYHVAEQKYGIEFRHPFFDRRLIEFMLSLPPEYKFYQGVSKTLLRESMKGILPDKIRLRKSKASFNEVLRQQISAIDLDALLDHAEIAELGLIEQARVDELKKKYLSGEMKSIIYFWQILNLEYWYRFNFTKSPATTGQ